MTPAVCLSPVILGQLTDYAKPPRRREGVMQINHRSVAADFAAAQSRIRQSYRIVTDGRVYRVQKWGQTGWLWWKKWKWLTVTQALHEDYWYPREFRTLEQAQEYVHAAVRREAADEVGWTPVAAEATK